jgi:hypothetical protein
VHGMGLKGIINMIKIEEMAMGLRR